MLNLKGCLVATGDYVLRALLELFFFIWQPLQFFFSEPHTPYQWPVPEHWQPTATTPQGDTMISTYKIRRAVGYCENTECEEYTKGVFLLNHGDTFYCPRCEKIGFIEPETGKIEGKCGIYKEVRVEYNYDPIEKRYRGIAIVRDESLWGQHDVYHIQSPLIKTEKRGMKVAEATLANLNMLAGALIPGEIPRTVELIVSFDVPRKEFNDEMERLQGQLENSALVKPRKAQPAKRQEAIKANTVL
jgi:ribosomal protein S27AE